MSEKGCPVHSGSRADVLIIGAGASGSVAAKRLAEAGMKVVCLEQGRWISASDYPGDKLEWEILAMGPWNADPNIRRLPEDYPCEVSTSDIDMWMFNGVGGGTIVYGGNWNRAAPSDFQVRTLDGVASDWPFTYADLLPYYERIEEEAAVAGLGGNPAFPPGALPPLPPHPINKTGRKVADGLNRLGWHWWPAPNAIASRDYGNLKQCVRRGTCYTGCPDGAKASFDLTHWPTALKHGAQLVTGARVREITTNERGLATGAVYVDRSGMEHHQEADVVVLTANAVGTARLLLLSRNDRYRDGLANSSGLVGRRLMTHPNAKMVGVFEDQLESWLGPTGQTITSMQFYETDESRGFVRGALWHAMSPGGPLMMLAHYRERGPDAAWWGPAIHDTVARSVGHGVHLAIIPEDLPEDENCVTLDPDLQDSDGIPAPKIVYRVGDNSRKLLDFHIARATEAFGAAGAVDVLVTRELPSGHLMGTAVMGRNPATSVVDEYGRTHDVPNLYIWDGSVFPTSTGVNPTATMCAVALRCADHLVTVARHQEVPV